MTISIEQPQESNRKRNGNGRAEVRVESSADGRPPSPGQQVESGVGDRPTAGEKVLASRPLYDCSKCPGYCCSYAKIVVDRRDLDRLARRFGLTREAAELRFTKVVEGEIVLRHQKDDVYGSVCTFFDKEERRCTVYEARPAVCREYPDRRRCGYYDFLLWERRHQGDVEFVPLLKE